MTYNLRDLIGHAKAFDAAWNAHDMDGVMHTFTEEAVIKCIPPLPEGETFSGPDEIRKLVELLLPGFHIHSQDHRVVEDKVAWRATVRSDYFKRMGLDEVHLMAEAVIPKHQISFLSINLLPDTLGQLERIAGIAESQ